MPIPSPTAIAAIVVAVIIGGLLFLCHYLNGEVNSLQNENGKYQSKLDEFSRALQSKDRDIDLQNAAIDKLKTDSDARIKAAEERATAANLIAQASNKTAQGLLSRTAPPNVDNCKAANDLINEYLNNRNKPSVQTPIPPAKPLVLSWVLNHSITNN